MKTNKRFSGLKEKCLAAAILILAGACALEAQDTNVLVQTNSPSQNEDLLGTDASQAADTMTDDMTGTNTVEDTNQMAAPGPDGRARRLRRRALNRPREGSQTNDDASASPNGANSAMDYSAFRLVADRNIFDPNRVPHSGRPATQPKTVDAFTLVGTMSYEKGIFAFFDGTSSDYKKVLKPDDTIAGYKVDAISADSVKLKLNTNTIELSVGTQMRRRDDGSWERSANSEAYTASSASSASNSSSEAVSTGAESDIIKKMMQRREKE